MLKVEITKLVDTTAARVALVGDLDEAGGKVARRQLAREVDAGSVDLTIDLDRVGAIESSGLAALIATLRRARDRGGNVRVRTSLPHVRRVMDLTGLSRVFRMPAQELEAHAPAA